MIACSLNPEGIIAMDFNSPQEVEEYISRNNLSITHWSLYGVLADELVTLHEEKDGIVLQDLWNEYLKEYREKSHLCFDDVR